jgi:hypothetical protein
MAENRARLRLKGTGYSIPFYGPASVLKSKNGIVFPYTPVITSSMTTEYSQYDLVHSNYPIQSFIRHRPGNINITAQFINQTIEDAQYTAGVLHFLSVVMKMHFGTQDTNAGTPPPLLEFSAYGLTNFNRVPVFVSTFSTTYPDDVDYVSFNVNTTGRTDEAGSHNINLPAIMSITIELLPHYPANMQTSFDLTTFANGNLYSAGFI